MKQLSNSNEEIGKKKLHAQEKEGHCGCGAVKLIYLHLHFDIQICIKLKINEFNAFLSIKGEDNPFNSRDVFIFVKCVGSCFQ